MPRQNRCQNSFHVSINVKGAKGTIPCISICFPADYEKYKFCDAREIENAFESS